MLVTTVAATSGKGGMAGKEVPSPTAKSSGGTPRYGSMWVLLTKHTLKKGKRDTEGDYADVSSKSTKTSSK